MNVILFGNTAFAGIIKYLDFGRALNPMMSVLIRHREGEHKERPCEDKDRGWNDASISQGMNAKNFQ